MQKNKEKIGCILGAIVMLSPLILFGIFILLSNKAEKQVAEMVASDNPAERLILAVDSGNVLIRWEAEDALAEIGDPLLLALTPACMGEGVSSADYNSNAGNLHPFVFMGPNGDVLDWTYDFLKDWGPENRQNENVQIVVCATTTRKVVETCRYQYGYTRTRIQEKMKLDIREAATGNIINQIYVDGKTPKDCPGSLSSNTTVHEENITGFVQESEVREILEGYYGQVND